MPGSEYYDEIDSRNHISEKDDPELYYTLQKRIEEKLHVSSCNKYVVCPTYNELLRKTEVLSHELAYLLDAFEKYSSFKEGTSQSDHAFTVFEQINEKYSK